MTFTADHTGFYRSGTSFSPKIDDNVALIPLPARLKDDLDWSTPKALAEHAVQAGKAVLWELELGLSEYRFTPHDSAAFFSFTVAIDHFASSLWPLFKEHTLGISFYRGAFNPAFSFPYAAWEELFLEWLEVKIDPQHDYALFAVQTLAEYFHRLLSFLPDAVLPFAFIDEVDFRSPAKAAQLFSSERFEHLVLMLHGKTPWVSYAPAPLALYLPKDPYITSAVLAQMDALIAQLSQAKKPFRIIPEEKLTEQWNGVDTLIVPTDALSAQGKRKLLGFCAAGGAIAALGSPIGLPDEISINKLFTISHLTNHLTN